MEADFGPSGLDKRVSDRAVNPDGFRDRFPEVVKQVIDEGTGAMPPPTLIAPDFSCNRLNLRALQIVCRPSHGKGRRRTMQASHQQHPIQFTDDATIGEFPMFRPDLHLALKCGIAAMTLLLGHVASPMPNAPDEEQLAAAYDEFRRLFAAEQFADALPLAIKVVQLHEAIGRDAELANAYGDLGSVQLRMGSPADAEESFMHAIELLAAIESISSPRLIAPLAGLAAAYQAQEKSALAADALRSAIAISRRGSGLFNTAQLPLLESLVNVYETLGDAAGSEQELRYAVQILEHAYGPDDLRVLPAIQRLAEWYDRNDRAVQARLHWARMVEVAAQEDGGRNAATVTALIAIAHSHRLQYVRNPESIGFRTCPVDAATGERKPFWNCADSGSAIGLDKAGEAAVLKALELLDSTAQPPAALLVSVLLELGDWYMTARKPDLAIPYYQRAWPLIPETLATGELHPLLAPVPLLDRPPSAAVHNRSLSASAATPIEFSLTVMANGATAEIKAITDASSTRVGQLRRALGQAIFRPRFEDGRPVATEGYRHVEFWYETTTEAKH
jgi:tetratricopeptide (TPR) repeat protein